jgi:RNA polymerase sigma-70 factor, ECF subfamily
LARKAGDQDAEVLADARREVNELVRRSAEGDRAAFRMLYDKLAPQLFALASRMLRDRAAAEDVVQETFLTVWKRLDRFDPALGSASGWLVVIARNKCLDRLRSRVRTVNEEEGGLAELPDLSQSPESAAISSSEAARLRRCMEQLSAQQKEAVLHAYFNGYTQEETATAMQAPLGTVKSWVRRALQHLKGCLET